MFIIAGLIEISIANVLFGVMPEPLTLLVFGIGLMGATAGLRRILKRQDSTEKTNVKPEVDSKG